MAFNVSQFRSELQFDGARPNLFEVNLTFPTAVPGSGDASRKALFQAKSAQLPGSTIGQVPLYYFGRELKFAGNRTFTDWTLQIINDEDFTIRKALESWMNGINSHNLNVRNPLANAPLGYSVDGDVTQFGKQGNVLKRCKFVGLFPTDVSAIDVDWGSNDTIEEFTVTLSYQWWESVEDGVV